MGVDRTCTTFSKRGKRSKGDGRRDFNLGSGE